MHESDWRLEADCLCGRCIKGREAILERVVVTVRNYVNAVDGQDVPELATTAMVEILEAVVSLI